MSTTSSGTLLTIAEFLQTARINERELLDLLARGRLAFEKGSDGELRIDVGELDIKSFSQSALDASPTLHCSELQIEAAASVVLQELDPILDEALDMALRWLAVDAETAE